MSKIEKVTVINGVYWISVPEINFNVLCGCPADLVKNLIRIGLIKTVEINGISCETGPNAILLSDVPVQNGTFSNLAEFPVLQMLYRQGMILPNHPNNTGKKPLLIGRKNQVKAQMKYIYRGNYGLTKEELAESGLPESEVEEIYMMKLKFAFGKINSSEEFTDSLIVDGDQVEIINGLFIKRNALNVYEFSFKEEKVIVDLNLNYDETYSPPYRLGHFNFPLEHFAIIHSGEGDGWDIHNPCMGSILMYNGKIYLIDAHPNIHETLVSLGISVSAISGIFHTHCHDDHFSGLTSLIEADHRLKYFATPLVRKSVEMKISALLDIPDVLTKFFEVKDLTSDQWNEVEGLLVKPLFSPHPVETSNFLFKVIADGGYKTYYHMADISSFDV